MDLTDVPTEIQVVFVDYLPARVTLMYQAEPPELLVNRARWAALTPAEQSTKLHHELGHYCTGTIHLWSNEPGYRATVLWLEGKATRRGLRDQVPDEAVTDAIADGCDEVWEFAAAWRVDEATAVARLRVYQQGSL